MSPSNLTSMFSLNNKIDLSFSFQPLLRHFDVGKDKVPMSQIIGFPMGATFFFDGTNVTQVKEEELNVEGLDEVESSKDNRHIFDRSDNQILTAEDVQSLKSSGSSGNVRISCAVIFYHHPLKVARSI